MTTATPRRFAATLTALGVAAALGACSAPGAPAELVPGPWVGPGDVGEAAGHNDADTQFAQLMIVHHEGAVEMAGLALERASDARIRSLAHEIAAAQGPEIAQMSTWLEQWGADAPGDAAGEGVDDAGMQHGAMDDAGMAHGAMEMDGMDHHEAMASLSELDGPDFDRRFLELMVDHHRGAIEMAEVHRADGRNPEALELAGRIIDDQTEEIAVMEDLLRDL